MRIKMQCPDCGKWFTLQLSVKEAGESHAPVAPDPSERDERRPATPERAARARAGAGGGEGGARRSLLLYRMAPILAVVALVLIWFFAIGPAVERSRSTLVDETGAAGTNEPAAVDDTGAAGADEPAALETTGPVAPAAEEATGRDEPSSGDDESAVPVSPAEGSPGSDDALAAPAAGGPGLEIVLEASDRCWVRVSADGRIVSDLTMRAGERRTWKAESAFFLDVGSGEDIRIFLNGKDLGTAGRGPRVVEGLVVTSEGLSRG